MTADSAKSAAGAATDATAPGSLPLKLVGEVVSITPTTLYRWRRCRRHYLLRNLLQLPAVDAGPWADEGLKVHAILRVVHERGSCADKEWLDEVVENHTTGDVERLRGFLDRHATRCPQGAEALGHELEIARLHRTPAPVFMATASIDAVWIHDGVLDARDYKTGAGWSGDLADDARARVQAHVLAPEAERRGLRLQIRYEYLSGEVNEDPPAWEPDAEQVTVIAEELRSVAEAMRAEREFAGVGDVAICRFCEYRSICRDAAADDHAGDADSA